MDISTSIPRMRWSSAQSPFACSRCYLSHRRVKHFVSRHYSTFFTHTNSCDNPRPSLYLVLSRYKVFAGCCQPLLGIALSRRYLRESFSACKDPYPGCSCGAFTRFFPQDYGLPNVLIRSAPGKIHTMQFPCGVSFEAAVIR